MTKVVSEIILDTPEDEAEPVVKEKKPHTPGVKGVRKSRSTGRAPYLHYSEESLNKSKTVEDYDEAYGDLPPGAESVDMAKRNGGGTVKYYQLPLAAKVEGSEGVPSASKGMYAGEAAPEVHLAIFKRNMANPMKGVPWKYPSSEALEREVMSYMEFMVVNRIPLTVSGLCAWLGISTTTLSKWREQQDTFPLYPVISTAVSFIHAMTEQGAVDGNISATVFNFLAKNYWAMTETVNVTQTNVNKAYTTEEQRAIIDALPRADAYSRATDPLDTDTDGL